MSNAARLQALQQMLGPSTYRVPLKANEFVPGVSFKFAPSGGGGKPKPEEKGKKPGDAEVSQQANQALGMAMPGMAGQTYGAIGFGQDVWNEMQKRNANARK